MSEMAGGYAPGYVAALVPSFLSRRPRVPDGWIVVWRPPLCLVVAQARVVVQCRECAVRGRFWCGARVCAQVCSLAQQPARRRPPCFEVGGGSAE